MDTSADFAVAEGLARASAMLNTSRTFQGTLDAIVLLASLALAALGLRAVWAVVA